MPQNSPQMLAKLAALDPPAIALLDSQEIPVAGTGASAEVVQTDQGMYISSPANGWVLCGPFGVPPQS